MQVSANIENGIVKQKAVFLDRDGTINKPDNFVSKPENFELIDGAADAIKKINQLGFLAIVITNQPVIARGEVDFETLDQIHLKMKADLEKNGAYLDDIFYCPHDPGRDFPGGRPEYRIDCECRKPKPGMILQAAKKHNIDLTASWMIGDNARDTSAGKAAGCKTALITNKTTEQQTDSNVFCSSLKEFTGYHLK